VSQGESVFDRPARGTRGPVPEHSREQIARAAIAIADEKGLAAASMRTVAASLGTSAGSLYRYLSSRDDLLALMVDAASAGVKGPSRETGDWLEAMLDLARQQLKVLNRHPWLVEILPRHLPPGPNAMAFLNHCLRILEPVPADDQAKYEAIAMMTGVVTLFVRNEAATRARNLFERTVRAVLTGLLAQDR
jgi:AcrR family transcriptional regulator